MKSNLDLRYELEGVFDITMKAHSDCWAYNFENPEVYILILDGSYRVSFGGFLITDDIKEVIKIFKRLSDNPTDFVPVF
jgi:hypothetical protein